MITLTRKMFTMILSVVVYKHALTLGQWGGAATVFAGIGVEAWVKRRGPSVCRTLLSSLFRDLIFISAPLKDMHAKRVIQEKERARIKQL